MDIYEKHIKLQNEHIELLKQFKEYEKNKQETDDFIERKINQINELKNTIEKQEIIIDKMKNCENCIRDNFDKYIITEDGFFRNPNYTNGTEITCDNVKCVNYNKWELKED